MGFIVLILGLVLEIRFQGAAESAEEDMRVASEIVVQELRVRATDAEERIASAETAAATANTKAAALLAENVELERALAPREIEFGALARALSGLPKVPLFISSIDREEPKEVAGAFGILKGMNGNNDPWTIATLPPVRWHAEGISIEYVKWRGSVESPAERIAVILCKSLNSEGISARTDPIPTTIAGDVRSPPWPLESVPPEAVIINVGKKPNHFWENKMLREKGLPEYTDNFFCTNAEAYDAFTQQRRDFEKLHPPSQPPQ